MIRATLLLGLLITLGGCQSSIPKPFSFLNSRSNSAAKTISHKKVTLSKSEKTEFQLVVAAAAEKRGDEEAAIEAYEHAKSMGANQPEVVHRLAVLYDKRGKHKKASELFAESSVSLSGDCEFQCDLGYHYYLQRDWEQSRRHLEAAIQLKPDMNRPRNILGMILARSGEPDTAIVEFVRSGLPEAEAHANAGLALLLEGNVAEANQHMGIAANLDSSNKMELRLASYRDAMASMGRSGRVSKGIGFASHRTPSVATDATGTVGWLSDH